MDSYLLILKEKANKIDADIKNCKNDKDCIKDALAAKVKSNLQKEDLSVLKEKAIQIKADISKCGENKDCILNIIEQRVKEILEEENELMTSIDSQQDFKPLYFDGIGHNFSDMG